MSEAWMKPMKFWLITKGRGVESSWITGLSDNAQSSDRQSKLPAD